MKKPFLRFLTIVLVFAVSISILTVTGASATTDSGYNLTVKAFADSSSNYTHAHSVGAVLKFRVTFYTGTDQSSTSSPTEYTATDTGTNYTVTAPIPSDAQSYKVEDITETTSYTGFNYSKSADKTGNLVDAVTVKDYHYVYKDASGNYLAYKTLDLGAVEYGADQLAGKSTVYGYNSDPTGFSFTEGYSSSSGKHLYRTVSRYLNASVVKTGSGLSTRYTVTYTEQDSSTTYQGDKNILLSVAVSNSQKKVTNNYTDAYTDFSTISDVKTYTNAATIYASEIPAASLITGTLVDSHSTSVTYYTSLQNTAVSMAGSMAVNASFSFNVVDTGDHDIKVPGGSFTLSTLKSTVNLFSLNVFGVKQDNLTTPAYATESADANGVVTFSNIPDGTYYLQQTGAKTGYSVNADLDASNAYVFNYLGTDYSYAPCWKIVVDSDSVANIAKYDPTDNDNIYFNLLDPTAYRYGFDALSTLDSTNNVITNTLPRAGTVEIAKVDADSNALAGAKFKLWFAGKDGAAETGGDDVEVGETAASAAGTGIATWSGDLPALGTYYFKESAAPDGYILDPTKTDTFTITSDDYSAVLGKLYYKYTQNIVDDPIAVKFKVVYKDDHSTVLPGSTFKLYGNLLMTGSASAEATSDDSGIVTFNKLPAGTYYMKQTASKAGYMKSSVTQWRVTVKNDGTATIEEYDVEYVLIGGYPLEVPDNAAALSESYLIENDAVKGSVKLTLVAKADDYTNPLALTYLTSGSFGVYKVVGGEVSDEEYAELNQITATIDADTGYANISYEFGLENIPAGDYAVRQLSGPDGYFRDANTYYFSITDENYGETQVISNKDVTAGAFQYAYFVNDPITFRFLKVANDNDSTPLPGGKFLLLNRPDAIAFLGATADKAGANASQALKDALANFKETGEIDWNSFIDTLKEGMTSSDLMQMPTFQSLAVNAYAAQSDADGIVTFSADKSLLLSDPREMLLNAFGITSTSYTSYTSLNDLLNDALNNVLGNVTTLNAGTYYLLEFEAPSGYTASPVIWTVEINDDGTVYISLGDPESVQEAAGSVKTHLAGSMDTISEMVSDSGLTEDDIKSRLKDTSDKLGDILDSLVPVDTYLDKIGDYVDVDEISNSLKNLKDYTQIAYNSINAILENYNGDTIEDELEALSEAFSGLQSVGDRITGIFNNGLTGDKWLLSDFESNPFCVSNYQNKGAIVPIAVDSKTGILLPGGTYNIYNDDDDIDIENPDYTFTRLTDSTLLLPQGEYIVETVNAPKGFDIIGDSAVSGFEGTDAQRVTVNGFFSINVVKFQYSARYLGATIIPPQPGAFYVDDDFTVLDNTGAVFVAYTNGTVDRILITSDMCSLMDGYDMSTTGQKIVNVKFTDQFEDSHTITYEIIVSVEPDRTPPTLSDLATSDITTTGATVTFTSDEAGTYYYLVYSKSEDAPEGMIIRLSGGHGDATANSDNSFDLSGLTPSTEYTVYVVEADASRNISEIQQTTFKTSDPPDTTAPALSDLTVSGVGKTSATLTFTSDEAGTYYYLVYTSSKTTPAAIDVKSNGDSGDAVVGENIIDINDLTSSTEYIVYLVEEDEAEDPNLSEVYSSEAFKTDEKTHHTTTATFTTKIITTTEEEETTTSLIITPTGTRTSFSVTTELMDTIIKNVLDESENKGTEPITEINLNYNNSQTDFSVTISKKGFDDLADSDVTELEVSSPQITVALDAKAIDTINGSTTSDITITAKKVNVSDQYADVVGDRPVYSIEVTSGGKTISDFGDGKATVTIKYSLASGEDPDDIVIYYIPSGGGAPVMVKDCVYDPDTGTVTFVTTHFSTYAIGYNDDVSFTDVSGWYEDYVQFLAARGIMKGTGDHHFSPDANITRAEFAAILASLSGDDLSGYKKSSFSDVAATDWYFADVQWAYEKGIAIGSDGKFSPNAYITRQDIAVMIARYAEKTGFTLPELKDAVVYSDSENIESYAAEAVASLQKAGIISGSDGKFAPLDYATRSQSAKMIALLLKLIIG